MAAALVIIVLVVQLLILLALTAFIYLMLRPIISGAIFCPTSHAHVDTMVVLASPKAGEKIADLGSGDGRVLLAFAQKGAEAHGYEINPLLVMRARKMLKSAGFEKKAFVHWQSFWKKNLGEFDIITVYGFPNFMGRLGRKLKKEAAPGTRIVSNIYTFPGASPAKSQDGVHLYTNL